MKSLFAIITLITSLSFAADKIVEPGIYTATDVETSTIVATLNMRANKTVNLMLAAPDFEMPAEGCDGTYEVTGNIMAAQMICPIEGFEKMDVTIDITPVTPESVRSQNGVVVDVIFGAFGDEPAKFVLRKIK